MLTLTDRLRRRLRKYDSRLFRDINNLSGWWRYLFLVITQMGGPMAVVILAGIAWLSGHHDWTLKVLTYAVATLLATMAFKFAFNRPRPVGLLKRVHKRTDALFGHHGFPSGHTAMATVMALIAGSLLPIHFWWIVPLWIGLVGFSRIYLGAHMPVDVVGGFIVGVIVYTGGLVIEKLVQ